MIDLTTIIETLTTYQKYGWILRRVLVTDEMRRSIPQVLADLQVLLVDSDIAAAWFSRPGSGIPVAWEIRFLGSTPFALLETLNENDADFEESLSGIEARLRDAVLKKRTA